MFRFSTFHMYILQLPLLQGLRYLVMGRPVDCRLGPDQL